MDVKLTRATKRRLTIDLDVELTDAELEQLQEPVRAAIAAVLDVNRESAPHAVHAPTRDVDVELEEERDGKRQRRRGVERHSGPTHCPDCSRTLVASSARGRPFDFLACPRVDPGPPARHAGCTVACGITATR